MKEQRREGDLLQSDSGPGLCGAKALEETLMLKNGMDFKSRFG